MCCKNSGFYWVVLCFSAVLLIPFFTWICLTGGSWPVRRCAGGACCSVYYLVTLLLPMALVLPVTALVLAMQDDDANDDTIYVFALLAYLGVSACFASVFVCTSQNFFKLPTIFYGDFVAALACPVWPSDALPFKTRQRHWPARSIVNNVVQRGCHLVPKPPASCACLDPLGIAPCEETHLLWRYSFSLAEVELCKEIPEHYRRAYLALKWIVKKNTMDENNDGPPTSFMRSYYLKTVMFWELELAGVLQPADTEELVLQRLAVRLKHHINQRYLPHFFVSDFNLFNELCESDFHQMDELLQKVIDDPAPLMNIRQLKATFYAIGLCEALLCTAGRDYKSELCCNYASRLHYVW